MKYNLLLFYLLFTSFSLFAQNEIPDFANFTIDEQNLQTCDFDKEADAIIFFDVARSNYNDEHNLLTNRRIRFKILKERGIERANVEIPYYTKNNFEHISDLKAVIYSINDDGTTFLKHINNVTTFTQKVNDRVSILKFTLPNAKVGSIIEYEYLSTMEHYGGLQDWYFQNDIPILLSRYFLKMIPNAEFTYIVHKSNDLPIKIKNDKSNGTVNFEMNKIAGLRAEPYMDAPRDYLQRVEFQLAGYSGVYGSKINFMTTWKQTAQELMGANFYGRQLDKTLSHSDDIILKAMALPVLYDRMNLIYNYVRNNFRWNGVNAKFADEGLKNVWEKRTGTNGEINLVLVNLLKSADIETYPLMVSERDHGKVTTQYPILDQFNKVVAYIIINNKTYVLDATETNTPANTIPFNILNTNAFIVNPKKPDIIQLTNDVKSSSTFINLYASIGTNGLIKGEASISSSDYAKIPRVESFIKSKESFKKEYFQNPNASLKIDSFEVKNANNDSFALEQHLQFSSLINTSGSYKMINYNLFTGLEKNPFVSDNRFTNVNYGSKYITSVHAIFDIPSNWKPDDLPKNIQLVMPDKSIMFARQISFDSNSIIIDLSFKINKTIFPPDEYPILKEYYKKLNDLLNEQVVLTGK